MKVIGDLICEALKNINEPGKLAGIKEQTKKFCSKFPMFAK